MIHYEINEDKKLRAGRNRTLDINPDEVQGLQQQLLTPEELAGGTSGIIWADFFEIIDQIPDKSVDLLFLDPPYNLSKNFHGVDFKRSSVDEYSAWLERVIQAAARVLAPTASIYICGDWLTSASIFEVASKYFTIQNRITWEREKGRGATRNWKNCSEDVWFCTVDKKKYTFNADAVKLRRRVLAPYRDDSGAPKDWAETSQGKFRDTAPSNLWTDITIPFWSMPENTDHPTQKSEKMLAKIILASTNEGDMVLDPFAGSGTTPVVAKKLKRQYLGIDLNERYCLWAQKRLQLADRDSEIQGLSEGVFWERNTLSLQMLDEKKKGKDQQGPNPSVALFSE